MSKTQLAENQSYRMNILEFLIGFDGMTYHFFLDGGRQSLMSAILE